MMMAEDQRAIEEREVREKINRDYIEQKQNELAAAQITLDEAASEYRVAEEALLSAHGRVKELQTEIRVHLEFLQREGIDIT